MEEMNSSPKIEYPYMPEGKTVLYVPEDNPYIQMAKKYAREHSLDSTVPTGSVLVMNGAVIGLGANGSDYHKTHECERVKRGIPTGQNYELCEGCHPKNHSEPRAIENAKQAGHDTAGADLYLWGHYWCCEPCWKAMVAAGIKNVYLMEGSEILFNKANPNNIVGHQFDN
jgi:deoxycytidylate deaminase